MFADLVGSTALGSEGDPERVRSMLERFYDAMAAEIQRAGGAVEKFIGDAVMAVFGVPVAHEDDAERALHAALAMRSRLAELFGGRLQVRIGVNTGHVVVGRARESSSFVSGDAVNVAARLEQAADAGEILIGERTAAAVGGAFELSTPATVAAKGKPGGVVARRLVRALSLSRPRGVGGLGAAFVGRESELELLAASFVRVVADGRPHLVTILGDAGVGKTRLAREFWRWLAEEAPDSLRRTGRCLAYGQGITYWALGEVLKEHFGALESDEPEKLLAELGERTILGLTVGLKVAADLDPRAARDRLHEGWIDFVGELCADRPLVLLVEDLHWGEEELFDLLERLLRSVAGPMLLVCTARPDILDRRPGWGGVRRSASAIELEPLSAAESKRMVDALVGPDAPDGLGDVVGRADGNPFFVEELLAALIDEAILVRRDDGWELRDLPQGLAAPDSVQAVISARIDLLSPGDKAALQAASVIGRAFWAGPLYELVPEADPDFVGLEDRDFIRRRPGSSIAGDTEYAFRHQLTREVAYASLPKWKRARLHAAFADWLERFGGGRDEHASLLAHHYAEAARPEDADLAWPGAEQRLERLRGQAVLWLRRAAELATSRYELPDAQALLERALALESHPASKIEILRMQSLLHLYGWHPDRFRAALEAALALAPEAPVAAEIYAELAFYRLGRAVMWTRPPPAELGEAWLAKALELAEPGSAARARALVAHALSTPEAGVGAAQEALRIAEALGDPQALTGALEAQGVVATVAGRVDEACRWADRALDHAATLTDADRAFPYWIHGFAYLRGGRFAEAARAAETFEEMAAHLTPHHDVHAVALHTLVAALTGRWEALAELAERAREAADANEETPCQFNWRSLLVCALGLAHLGDERAARRLEERAVATPAPAGPAEREPALLRLALVRGDLEEAARIVEQLPVGIDPYGAGGAAARLDALLALGDRERVEQEAALHVEVPGYSRPFALRALGVVREERPLIQQALAAFEQLGLGWHAEQTRMLL